MLLSRLADGPSLVLSPPQDHVLLPFPSFPSLDVAPGDMHGGGNSFVNGLPPSSSSSASKANLAVSAPIAANPSRKRSCREAGFESDNASAMPMPASASSMETPFHEAYSGSSYGGAVTDTAHPTPVPDAPTRKSQRLDTLGDDDMQFSDRQASQSFTRTHDCHIDTGRRPSSSSSRGPLVDDATCLLGISWQRIEDDGDKAAALCGWKKYIDIQFKAHLHSSQFLMKNRALNVYLVAAIPTASASPSSSFYLFSDDLTQAQLVGSSWEATVHNLRSVPIAFEGTHVLRAADKLVDQYGSTNGSMMHLHPAKSAMPLLQTPPVQPVTCGGHVGLNGGMGMGTGMDIDL